MLLATRLAARAARPAVGVAAARGIKQSTHIVGLAVEPNAKPILVSLYNKTLAAIEPVPAASDYRKYVEGVTKERLAVVESTDDLDAIEQKIGCGQVEQLIRQVEDELALIPTLLEAGAFEASTSSALAEEILTDLKRRGIALQRDDIPMRPSVDYPTEAEVELELPAPPEEKKA